MLVSLKLTSREVIEVKKSKTRRTAVKFNKICFSRWEGVAASWKCHAHFQGAKLKLKLRAFCWCIVCFCTINGSFCWCMIHLFTSNGFFRILKLVGFSKWLPHPVLSGDPLYVLLFFISFSSIFLQVYMKMNWKIN